MKLFLEDFSARNCQNQLLYDSTLKVTTTTLYGVTYMSQRAFEAERLNHDNDFPPTSIESSGRTSTPTLQQPLGAHGNTKSDTAHRWFRKKPHCKRETTTGDPTLSRSGSLSEFRRVVCRVKISVGSSVGIFLKLCPIVRIFVSDFPNVSGSVGVPVGFDVIVRKFVLALYTFILINCQVSSIGLNNFSNTFLPLVVMTPSVNPSFVVLCI